MDKEDVYIKLFCVVVGEGYPLPVVINPKDNTVRELKEVIKAKKMNNFPAGELRLFLSKRGEESEWMDTADAAAVKLNEHCELPPDLEEMDPKLPLNDAECFGDEFQSARGQVHVLVVLPKVWSGKRGWPDVWAAQSEQPSTEPSFIIADNRENLKFAKPYQHTAEKLKNAKEVDEVLEAIALIRAARNPTPFIVLESSSGMGKTQMAFNLMARRDMDVFYFISEAGGEVMQDVYTTFSNRSGSFKRCVEMDFPTLGGASYCEIVSAPELYTYGFIWALLSGVDTFKGWRTRADVANARKEREMCGETEFLFFLDEFPRLDHQSENRVRFIRNVFRSFGFTVILSSTTETARNPLQSGSCGSRANEDSRLWCIVQPTFPSFQDPVVGSMCSELQEIIQHSRPLFAKMAVDFMNKTKTTDDPNTNLVGYLDEMAGNLGKRFVTLKRRSEWFRYGQVRLLLAADFEKRGDSRLINEHYARLQDNEMFRLSFPPGGRAKFHEKPETVRENVTLKNRDMNKVELVKNDEEWPWICQSKFPDVNADVLLYLCLMGGKYYQPLIDPRGWPIPFYWAYRIAEAADCELFRPMRLGAVATGAVVMASHRNGLAGFDFEGVLGALLYELDMQSSPDIRVKFSNEVAELLASLKVPFLAPLNCRWPGFLKNTKLNLGDIVQIPNKDMLEATFLDDKISVECKDYGSQPLEMEGVLERAARTEAMVHLVVTTSLQGKCLGDKKKSSMSTEAFQGGVHRSRFYRIGILNADPLTDGTGKQWRNDISPVEWMSDVCQDKPVDRVVIFLETPNVTK